MGPITQVPSAQLSLPAEAPIEMSKTYLRRPDPTAVCQRCQRPLGDLWRSGRQLCWQCGIDYELFHPETRWRDESNAAPPQSMIRLRSPKGA